MIKIATELFKREVNRAVKGAGNNALVPLTTMLGVKVRNNQLLLCTQDGNNQTQITIDKVAGEDISITVNALLFSKLISKMSSEVIELDVQESKLVVKGNGKYEIALVVDEEGVVDYPDIKFTRVGKTVYNVQLSTLKVIHNHNRLCLATDYTEPYLTGYYIAKEVVSSDGEVACFTDIETAKGLDPILVTPSMLNLLVLMNEEDITLIQNGNQLYFNTSTMTVCGNQLEGLADYPVDALCVYTQQQFPSCCKLTKGLLLEVLDRLSLFVEAYDKGAASFVFTADGLQISSLKDSSVEVLAYTESTNFTAHACILDVVQLKTQVQAIQHDIIELHYGNEACIKLVTGNVTTIISVLEDGE